MLYDVILTDYSTIFSVCFLVYLLSPQDSGSVHRAQDRAWSVAGTE